MTERRPRYSGFRARVYLPLGHQLGELPSGLWIVARHDDLERNSTWYVLGSVTAILPPCLFGSEAYSLGDEGDLKNYLDRRAAGEHWDKARERRHAAI